MTRHNFGRALATATAAVSAIALAAPSATAANLGPAQFSGAAKAQALQLTLNAPTELLGLLPTGSDASSLIDLGVSLTEVASSTSNELFASSRLLTGLLPVGADSSSGEDSYSNEQGEVDLGFIQVGAGTHHYNIDRATRAVTSDSTLAHVRIATPVTQVLKSAPAVTGLTNDVNALVDTVVTEVDGLTGGIIGEVNTIVNDIEQTLEDAAGLTLDIPDVTLADLASLPNVLEADILEIKKLWSATSVAPVGDMVRSQATSGILGASILGGLVEIPEWTFTAWAETAGLPGTANWGGNTEALSLNVAGTNILSLNGSKLTVQGIELDLNDPALAGIIPDPTGLVAELDGLIGDLLDLTGLSVTQGSVVGEAAPDGSFATATASAFSLSLAPLHATTAIPELASVVSALGLGSADQVLRLQLDLLPATATARAAAAPAVSAPETPQLPRTGGGAAAMALGMLGMGGAATLRRKF